jgi:hypothetical protein
MAHRFDELVQALADARSRREMLKLAGASLMGTVIAFVRPKDALADNSACAMFCNAVFEPGPARGKCKSDAAHGMGLCIACDADPDRACGLEGTPFCCGPGEICVTVNGIGMCMAA